MVSRLMNTIPFLTRLFIGTVLSEQNKVLICGLWAFSGQQSSESIALNPVYFHNLDVFPD